MNNFSILFPPYLIQNNFFSVPRFYSKNVTIWEKISQIFCCYLQMVYERGIRVLKRNQTNRDSAKNL